jgi:hypothetical protein
LNPPLPGITIVGPTEVAVDLEIAPGVQKKYTRVPIKVMRGDTRTGRETEPRWVEVVLEGHPARLDKIRQPEAYIDLEGNPDFEGKYTVRVKVGTQVKTIKITPAYVAAGD